MVMQYGKLLPLSRQYLTRCTNCLLHIRQISMLVLFPNWKGEGRKVVLGTLNIMEIYKVKLHLFSSIHD